MKKLLFILIFCIALLIPVVNSQTDFTTNMKSCWNWDGDTTDDFGNFDGVIGGDPSNSATYGGGLGGGAYEYDGTGDEIKVGGESKNFNFFADTSFLICANDTAGGTKHMFSATNDPTFTTGYIVLRSSATSKFTAGAIGQATVESTTVVNDGEIRCYVLVRNASNDNLQIYINGILNASGTTPVTDDSEGTFFGSRGDAGSGWVGWIGISAYWENRTLLAGEIAELETNLRTGTTCPFTVADTDPPVITFFPATPDNNSFVTKVLVTFNVSITDASDLDQIILNFNGTNETGFVNGSTNFFSKVVNTNAEGLFTYQLFANDSAGNSVTTGTFQFTVDNTTPAIVYNFPLTDNSTVSKANGNVDIRGFNINLQNANLTIFNASNQIVFNNNTNLTNLTTANFNITDPISKILTGEPDDTYRFRGCFTDNGGLETCQETLFILDNTNPVASIVLSNNTPEETSVIQINGSCTDANGIQLLTIENNVSGTFTNVSTRNLNNVTSIIHIFNHTAVLGTISHKVTCQDAVLNSDQSVNLIYNSTEVPVDVTPPTAILAIGNITPLEGSTVQFNATCTDASGIKFVSIENNASGIFTNVSSTIPGNSSPFTHIFNHTAVLGTISHKATCVDGVDNSAQSGVFNYTSTALPVVAVEEAELPLSRVVQIGGMLVLIFIVLSFVFGSKVRGKQI